jgi:hypothetical protein
VTGRSVDAIRHARPAGVGALRLRGVLSEPLLPLAGGTLVLAAAVGLASEALLALSCGLFAGYSLSGST